MRPCRQTVEQPFGTVKASMGYTYFLTRGLARVTTEMSLHILAYNLKRVINILAVRNMKRIVSASAEMGRG